LHVPDLHCAACEAGVTQAVRGLSGIETVSVDLDAKTVRVAFDSTVTTDVDIRSRIERAGFDIAS
jgi:copper chaperone CopZ